MEDARSNVFDVVVAEGLDRFSRDQEHIAAFFKQMRFQGIPIVTVAEGAISELHIGLKGTMSSLFLKDLAQQNHRGLEGRVRKGKSAGGVTYGYDVVRDICADGSITTGDRRINEDQAKIVRRIFRYYSHGMSPRAIATNLNKDGIPGPRGAWGASTIYGNHQRGTGILNNEHYIGRLVWNRQRFVKDPDSGKRQARPNPPEDWVIEDVSELRVVYDDLWNAVKARQEKTRNAAISDGMFHSSMKEKLTALEALKSKLQDTVNSASDEPPVVLHPGLTDVYREQVTNLTKALRDPSSQAEATSIIRGLLNEIRLVPEKGEYTIELVGELAGLLALGVSQNEQSRPWAARSVFCSTVLVAGAGFEPATFRL